MKRYLILMTVATLVCWVAWMIVLFRVNPLEAEVLNFIFFYLAFFLALTGTFSILGLIFRIWLVKHELVIKHAGTAFRQAVWFSILIIGSLILLKLGLLIWWVIVLLIFILAILEFFFLSYQHKI
ncbi:MAG: hypothetical protein WC480_03185 [Patescibacteria group bacterium]